MPLSFALSPRVSSFKPEFELMSTTMIVQLCRGKGGKEGLNVESLLEINLVDPCLARSTEERYFSSRRNQTSSWEKKPNDILFVFA